MQRNFDYPAIVLKIQSVGEGHASVVFLINDNGSSKLIHAFFYGLKKTKRNYGLRSFQSGRLWLYFNPVNQTYKVSDFQATTIRLEISESLVRIWSASLACELAIKMHGNIDFSLITAFLDGIAKSSDEECKRAILRFLWRLIRYAGLAPNYKNCSSCGINFIEARQVAYFERSENDFYCSDCIDTSLQDFLELSPESQNFLKAMDTKAASQSRQIKLSAKSEHELRALLFFIVQDLVGTRLKTLDAGII